MFERPQFIRDSCMMSRCKHACVLGLQLPADHPLTNNLNSFILLSVYFDHFKNMLVATNRFFCVVFFLLLLFLESDFLPAHLISRMWQKLIMLNGSLSFPSVSGRSMLSALQK